MPQRARARPPLKPLDADRPARRGEEIFLRPAAPHMYARRLDFVSAPARRGDAHLNEIRQPIGALDDAKYGRMACGLYAAHA
ncbi:MAG TPA: hypothetical protein VF654_03045 [Pyrinomonadaceae bacterium]